MLLLLKEHFLDMARATVLPSGLKLAEIESASDLIKAGDYAQAIDQLGQMAFQNLRTLSWVMPQLC